MVLFYAELAIPVRINAKMHYFEPESLKNFLGRGTAPPQAPKPHPLGACGASPHICHRSYFFTILTLRKTITIG